MKLDTQQANTLMRTAETIAIFHVACQHPMCKRGEIVCEICEFKNAIESIPDEVKEQARSFKEEPNQCVTIL